MAKNMIRLDIVNGNPRTFIHTVDLEQGYFLEEIGKAGNDYLGEVADYEAYSVKLASATTKRGKLLLHASVPNQYDERLQEKDFVLPKGRPGRGYQVVMGDVITLPAIMCGGAVSDKLVLTGIEVNDEVALGDGGKLKKVTASETAIGYIEAIEELVVPMYQGQWGATNVQDIVQVSCVVKFY